ncbi:MAG: hypothetical protein NZ922_01235 [Candidatus Methanomethyliaceae archaeon]|nr:hypothetical protein [Candidatus Methanomethyliaceae archaeon]MDW7971497.1 hypothetical protein [Nitrososphaerota archaeon]
MKKSELLKIKYQIKLAKNTATFIWSSTPQNPLRGSIDLRTKINPRELLILAKKFHIPFEEDKIFVQDLEVYNRLLIYACVRPFLRKNLENIHKLEKQIFNMTSWDAHYWASAFRESWWKYGKLAKLKNIVRAFKLFFEI